MFVVDTRPDDRAAGRGPDGEMTLPASRVIVLTILMLALFILVT